MWLASRVLPFLKYEILMEKEHIDSLKHHLANVEDPRIDRKKLHLLEDILLLTVMAVICGCEGWEEIELFGKTRLVFLKQHLQLPHGIPSHDTIRRVFMRLKPKSFEAMFMRWASSLGASVGPDIISLDGKTARGSHDKRNGKKAIHIVSAWANARQMVLGQVKVDDKSNEITAIPELLDELDIEGDIVTIDSMGCQKNIAEKIIGYQADYVLAVKENQPSLLAQIELSFRLEKPAEIFQTIEKDHGRIETRRCSVIRDLKWVEVKDEWPGLKTIVRMDRKREIGDKTEEETQYYIASLDGGAEETGRAIRSHWGIEASLHWSLDVTFREDQSRKRVGNSDQNFALVRKIALNLLKADKTVKIGINGKRLKAGWDTEYLLKILRF
jgi:predicted transposase YbfD/YdcC